MNRKPVIIGERYREILDTALKAMGLVPLYLPDNPFVAPALAGHADLSVFRYGQELILAPYLRGSGLAADLAELGYETVFADIRQGAEYPADCGLNACAVGERLLCRRAVTAPEILARFADERVRDFRQGYARCSICVVDDGAVITADNGIAAAADGAGLDVLNIAAGGFELPGYAHGFIGGSSFKPSADKLMFTGSLSQHPDVEKIERFIRGHGVEPIYITQNKPIDIGGAVVL